MASCVSSARSILVAAQGCHRPPPSARDPRPCPTAEPAHARCCCINPPRLLDDPRPRPGAPARHGRRAGDLATHGRSSQARDPTRARDAPRAARRVSVSASIAATDSRTGRYATGMSPMTTRLGPIARRVHGQDRSRMRNRPPAREDRGHARGQRPRPCGIARESDPTSRPNGVRRPSRMNTAPCTSKPCRQNRIAARCASSTVVARCEFVREHRDSSNRFDRSAVAPHAIVPTTDGVLAATPFTLYPNGLSSKRTS